MRFKEFYYLSEGLIDVPKEYIINYIDRNFDEFKTKIANVSKSKISDYIEENLLINGDEFTISIDPSIRNNEYISFLIDPNKYDIKINATKLVEKIKQKDFKNYLIESFIHEITHYLDKGLSYKKVTPVENDEDYIKNINSDMEFPAIANELVFRIKSLLEKKKLTKEQILDSFRYKTKFPDKIVNNMLNDFNEKNRSKFINYVVHSINN